MLGAESLDSVVSSFEWCNGDWFKPEGRPMYRSYTKNNVRYFVQCLDYRNDHWKYSVTNNGEETAFDLDYFENDPRKIHQHYEWVKGYRASK